MPYILPMGPQVPVVCMECGGTVLLAPARARSRKFCSRECWYAFFRHQIANGERHLPPPERAALGRARALHNHVNGGEVLRRLWEEAETTWYICAYCNEEFPSRAIGRKPLYCSRRCRARAQYPRLPHNLQRTCPVCGQTFWTRSAYPSQTCSYHCGGILGAQRRARPMRPARHGLVQDPRVPALDDIVALCAALRRGQA